MKRSRKLLAIVAIAAGLMIASKRRSRSEEEEAES